MFLTWLIEINASTKKNAEKLNIYLYPMASIIPPSIGGESMAAAEDAK